MSKKCPHCGIEVKYLAQHLKRKHPAEAPEAQPEPAPEPAPEPEAGGEILELANTGAGQAQGGQQYHCVECGYSPITQGTPSCPKCSTIFDWSKLE